MFENKLFPLILTIGITIGVHTLLISVFETIFYFKYISNEETKAFYSSVDNISDKVINIINTYFPTLSPDQKQLLRMLLFETGIEKEIDQKLKEIEKKAEKDKNERDAFNKTLVSKSINIIWIIAVILLCVGLLSLLLNQPVNWSGIFYENILVLVAIGVYEFIFFKQIASNYQIGTDNELDSYIITKIYDALKHNIDD